MKTWAEMGIPNPGSSAALDEGCTCPRVDNNYGRYAPEPNGGWWMTLGCPIHQSGEDGEEGHPNAPWNAAGYDD